MPLRPKVALALALVALATPQGCDVNVNPPRELNPQPIPPGDNGVSAPSTPATADAGSATGEKQPPSGSGASSNGGASSGSGSGLSTGSSSGSGSGSRPGSSSGGSGSMTGTGGSSDASIEEDAGGIEAGEPAPDSGSDAPGLEDARTDGESGDGSPSEAGEDAQGDAGCWLNSDCYANFPDLCNMCAWPYNRLVCVSNECVCACRVTYDGGGD